MFGKYVDLLLFGEMLIWDGDFVLCVWRCDWRGKVCESVCYMLYVSKLLMLLMLMVMKMKLYSVAMRRGWGRGGRRASVVAKRSRAGWIGLRVLMVVMI